MTEAERILMKVEGLCSDLSPGQKLPTTLEMAGRFNSSVFTVNQAIKALVNKGRLNTVTGKGIFVSERGPDADGDAHGGFAWNSSGHILIRFSPTTSSKVELAAWEEIIRIFERTNPHIRIVITSGRPHETAMNDLRLVSAWQMPALIENGEIADMSPFLSFPGKPGEYFPGVLGFLSAWKGVWWAPIWMNLPVIVYNRKLIEKLGIEPLSGENSLAEFAEHCQVIKEKLHKADVNALPGWNLLGYSGFIAAEGIDLFRENILLDESARSRRAWIEILARIRSYAGMHLDVMESVAKGESVRDKFYAGKGVILLDWNLQREVLENSGGFLVRPAPRGGQLFGASGLAVSSRTKNPVAVGHFLSFLMGKEAQDIFAGISKIPVRRASISDPPRKYPATLKADEIVHFHDRSLVPRLSSPIQVEILRQVIDPEMNRFLSMGLGAEQAAGNIIRKANDLARHIEAISKLRK